MSKNIEFLHLTVEGFRSYQKPTPFPLTGKGLVLIKGSNGAGKTTIFSALTWALFKINLNGTVNDKVQTWEKYRLPEWRGTRVTITFIVNGAYYMVARHLNFKGTTKGLKAGSALMIFKRAADDNFEQSDLIGDGQHKGDQQEYINNLIGIEPRTFLNSILFGQRMARLVSADNEEKRKLFETLFELDFIDPAKKKAQAKKSELEQRIAQLTTELQGKEALRTNLKLNLAEQRNLIASFNTQKTVRIVKVETKIAELKQILENLRRGLVSLRKKLKNTEGAEEIEKLRADYEEANTCVESAGLVISKLRKDKNDVANLLDSAEQTIKDTERLKAKLEKDLECVAENCPSCHQPLKKDEVAEVRERIKGLIKQKEETIITAKKSLIIHTKGIKLAVGKLEQAEAETKELRDSLINLGELYEGKRKLLKDLEQTKKEIGEKEALIPHYERNIQDAEKELATEKNAQPPKIDTKSTENKIAFLSTEMADIETSVADSNAELIRVSWWVSKAFGSGGLKAHVFSAMLGQLNEHIDRYAQRMGLRCRFSIDLSKASKPFITKCYINDFEVDYQDLSGGQKQKLDCVVSFAMHDLVNSISNINFLILDEVFEGLDPDNIEVIFDLIRLKSDAGKLVFVVTHSQLIDSLGSKSLYVEADMENMVSYIA